jgi:hypothetical protein
MADGILIVIKWYACKHIIIYFFTRVMKNERNKNAGTFEQNALYQRQLEVRALHHERRQ